MFQATVRVYLMAQRLALVVLLGLSIAILLSPQCGFADDKPNQKRTVIDSSEKSKPENPPFDLTYLHPNAMGVIAIRPSAIFSDPAMKPLACDANEGLAQLRQILKLSGEPKLHIEDIEEIIGYITIIPVDKKHNRNHSLIAGLTMIRATHDFDWSKLLRQLDPKTEEVRHENRVYYRSHFPVLLAGFSPNATTCYFMPDTRTVAFLPEEALSAFVKGKSIQRPHFSWDEDWKRVEHGLIAVAMDNRWARGLSKEQIGGEPGWAALTQNVSTTIAGVDWKEGIDIQAYLVGKDQAASSQIVKDIKDQITEMRSHMKNLPGEDAPKDAIQMVKELLGNMRVRRRDSTIRVHTTAKVNLADVMNGLFSMQYFPTQPK